MSHLIQFLLRGDFIKTIEKDLSVLTEMFFKTFLYHESNNELISEMLSEEGTTVYEYDDNEIILDNEHSSRALYFIIDGCVAITKVSGTRSVFLRYAKKGEFFGVSTLFCDSEDKSFYTSVKAKKACRVLMIPQKNVTELLLSSPDASFNYIKFLSRKIRFLNSRIDSYTTDNSGQRLMKYLYSLHEDDGYVNLPTSISKLSEHLNIGRASLYRAFDELESEGHIQRNGKKIKIIK